MDKCECKVFIQQILDEVVKYLSTYQSIDL